MLNDFGGCNTMTKKAKAIITTLAVALVISLSFVVFLLGRNSALADTNAIPAQSVAQTKEPASLIGTVWNYKFPEGSENYEWEIDLYLEPGYTNDEGTTSGNFYGLMLLPGSCAFDGFSGWYTLEDGTTLTLEGSYDYDGQQAFKTKYTVILYQYEDVLNLVYLSSGEKEDFLLGQKEAEEVDSSLFVFSKNAEQTISNLVSCCDWTMSEKEYDENALSAFDYVDLKDVPPYSGKPYVEVNGNEPDFSSLKYNEVYSDRDDLNRCGPAYACIYKSMLPTEPRGEIGQVKPSGWQTVKYDCVDGKYLYNRCHLIAYQLAGENANEDNLITGTRYMNLEGMLPFEEKIANYIKSASETDYVAYLVAPIFDGDNLIASGVQMQARFPDPSLNFNVFVYNVQPGVKINYADGTSKLVETQKKEPVQTPKSPDPPPSTTTSTQEEEHSYIVNVNTGKLHLPDCSSVDQMNESNKRYITCTRSEAVSRWSPCQRCCP